MREFLKRAKADYLLSSVLCIVLGIIFVVWKGGVIDVIGTLLSIAMIIVGIIYLGSFILSLATLELQRLSEFWYLQLESGFSSSRR